MTPSTFTLTSVQRWLVVQQRIGSVANFNLYWANYRNGFGVYNADFWLGLEPIYQLTGGGTVASRLRFEFQAAANGKWFSAEYASFYVDSETLGYAIHLSGYGGDAGDAFSSSTPFGTSMNGKMFRTQDQDSLRGCASLCNGGWWYDGCSYANMNGDFAGYFYWHPLQVLGLSPTYNLQTSRMMIAVN